MNRRKCMVFGHRWTPVLRAVQGCRVCGAMRTAWDDGRFSEPAGDDWLWHEGVPEGTLLVWAETPEIPACLHSPVRFFAHPVEAVRLACDFLARRIRP